MRTILAASLLLSAIACSASEAPPVTDEQEDADRVAGRYELTSTYDLTTSESLPGIITDVLEPLASLRDNPAATIIAILESTDDTIADLIDLLPSSVRQDLEDRINEFVADEIASGGVAGDIIVWADQISELLTNFDVVSQFEIGFTDADGRASANHALTAIRFQLDGEVQNVDTPAIINTLTKVSDISCAISDGSAGLEIEIAEHAFHLPLGELAVVAFNQALETSLGAANISEALGLVIDCTQVAQRVGPICAGPICLPVEDLCNDGLTALAGEIEKRIESIDFAELRLAGGRAALEDAAKEDAFPGQIDQWNSGTWQTSIEVDSLLTIPVEASFQATRM